MCRIPSSPRQKLMIPQSSMTLLADCPPNISTGCKKLPNMSHSKPGFWGLRISMSSPSQPLRPVAGAKKNWIRCGSQICSIKKWKWVSRQQVLETWIGYLLQTGFDSVLPWLASHATCMLWPAHSRSTCRTLVAGQLGRNPSSSVLQKERL